MSTLDVLTSPLLDLPGIRHGFFTRTGGVSKGLYEGLNVGVGSSDLAKDVTENRRRAAAHFGLECSALSTCYQVHSATALVATQAWADHRPEGDGVVTQTPGVLCGALAADCVPILFADPAAGIVAAAHAGWKGALAGIAQTTVAKMQSLGAIPSRIVAVLGPCIGPTSYEVGLEFRDRFLAADSQNGRFFVSGETSEKQMFDLPAFVLSRLRVAGVETCGWIGADTCTDEVRFYSNRRAVKRGEPDFGRLLSAIVLE